MDESCYQSKVEINRSSGSTLINQMILSGKRDGAATLKRVSSANKLKSQSAAKDAYSVSHSTFNTLAQSQSALLKPQLVTTHSA